MKLNETIELMNSEDYKERFKGEYAQLEKWDNETLAFKPTCPRSTYNIQIKAMVDYIAILEARAVMVGIDLAEFAE